jgi:transposase
MVCCSPQPESALSKPFHLRPITPEEMVQVLALAKSSVAFESRKARLLLALAAGSGHTLKTIAETHGYTSNTACNLTRRFESEGPDACRYNFNVESGTKRRKISPSAADRAIVLASEKATSLRSIMAQLIQEGHLGKNSNVPTRLLAKVFKVRGLTWQRTRYSLKKKG